MIRQPSDRVFRRLRRWMGLLASIGSIATLTLGAARADDLADAGLYRAWRLDLPLRTIADIQNFYLVDGIIYACGNDGQVRAIRAADGQHIWTRQTAPAMSHIYPPVPFQANGRRAIMFSLINKIEFVDPVTGLAAEGMKTIKTNRPVAAPVVATAETLFACETERWLQTYVMPHGIPDWRQRAQGLLTLAPIHHEPSGLFILASDAGLVAGLKVSDKLQIYITPVDGAPRGWLEHRNDVIYTSTANSRLYAMSAAEGELLWGYRLPHPPRGGPVATKTSVYQAVTQGGVQRIGIEADWPNWFASSASHFLAEWRDRVALLGTQGELIVARAQTGEPISVIREFGMVSEDSALLAAQVRTGQEMDDARASVVGISNRFNDAIIVASARGRIQCFRPVGGERLTTQDFIPPPTTRPAEPVNTVDEDPLEAPPETQPADAKPAVKLPFDPLRAK